MSIFVDADACPVKDEVYRVARRYAAKVYVVANASVYVPREDLIELVVVPGGFDVPTIGSPRASGRRTWRSRPTSRWPRGA